MQYKARNIAALDIVLNGLPNQMRVEVDNGLGVSAKTVGELRKLTSWPGDLAVITPWQRDPNSTVKVTRANFKTRLSPKT